MLIDPDGTRRPEARDLCQIRSARPGAPTRTVGVYVGDRGARWNTLARNAATEVERFLSRAYEAATNAMLSAPERGERVRQLSGPALAKLNEAATEAVKAKGELAQRLRTASATPGYDKVGHWEHAFDLRILDRLDRMPPAQRAGMIATVKGDPVAHLRMADALVRLPPEVSGLSHREHAGLRLAVYRALKPEEAEALDLEASQVTLAAAVVRAGLDAIRDEVGTLDDAREHAPAALMVLHDREPVPTIDAALRATEAPVIVQGAIAASPATATEEV